MVYSVNGETDFTIGLVFRYLLWSWRRSCLCLICTQLSMSLIIICMIGRGRDVNLLVLVWGENPPLPVSNHFLFRHDVMILTTKDYVLFSVLFV